MKKYHFIFSVIAATLLLVSCSSNASPPQEGSAYTPTTTISSLQEPDTKEESAAIKKPITVKSEAFDWGDIVSKETIILDSYDKLENPFFLGYNDSNVYFADWGRDVLTCYKYPLSGTEPTPIWQTEPNIIIIDSFVMGEALQIIECSILETGRALTNLRTIRDDGEHTTTTVYEGTKFPQISFFDNYIFIYTEESLDDIIKTQIFMLDIDDFQIKPIANRSCIRNDDGTLRGDMLLYNGGCGGTENRVLYYQVVSLEDEMLETDGKTMLYYYDIVNEKSYELLSLDRKLMSFSGNAEFFLASEYFYNPPFSPSARLYTFNSINIADWSFYQIPGINAPADVFSYFYMSNGIISFTSRNNIFFADVKNKTMQSFTFEHQKWRTRNYGDSLCSADFVDDMIVFHLFTLK